MDRMDRGGKMMKKDIEWAKNRIKNTLKFEALNDREVGFKIAMKEALELINQLDEPEALSQDWIDKSVVHVRGLGDIIEAEVIENLLVPKREVTETQAWEVLEEKYKITWIELRDNVDKLIEFLNKGYTLDKIENNESTQAEVKRFMDTIASEGIFKIGNKEYVVSEKPVIPNHVADWIIGHRDIFDLYPALRRLEGNSLTWEQVYKWYRENTHTFVNAYSTGEYEVEEEPKYNVLLKPRSAFGTECIFLYKQGDVVLVGSNLKYYCPEKDEFRLTEQEIKDFDPRYWAFANPVEGDNND